MFDLGGLSSIFGGLFGNSSSPYDKAMQQYQQYGDKATGVQNPFYQAGTEATGDYQDWLKGQKDPSGFINNLMGQYQESPYAQYQQQQSQRAGTNMASANGLSGSTPLADYMQNSAQKISSADQNQWLQNVLGINSQYGQGEQNLMSGGQNAANSMSGTYNNMGERMGNGAYGQQAGKNQDRMSIINGLLSMFGIS